MPSLKANGGELQLLWSFVWAAIFVVFDMGHFRRGCAKFTKLPQIVLGIILNLGIYVIECIFDFLNPMFSFGEKFSRSGANFLYVYESYDRHNSRNIRSIMEANAPPKSTLGILQTLQVSLNFVKFKLVKLTSQIRQNRQFLPRSVPGSYTRWRW